MSKRLNITLSPKAHKALETLCAAQHDMPMSRMISMLVLDRLEADAPKKRGPKRPEDTIIEVEWGSRQWEELTSGPYYSMNLDHVTIGDGWGLMHLPGQPTLRVVAPEGVDLLDPPLDLDRWRNERVNQQA